MVAVINYGLGNVSSILNMLKKIGAKDVVLVQDPSEIKFADKLILPGVGAFDTGMKLLKQSGLVDAINIHTLENKKPILGICLGMQMLGCSSEEGKESGLGYLDFVSKKFDLKNSMLKVPHMGLCIRGERKRSHCLRRYEFDEILFCTFLSCSM